MGLFSAYSLPIQGLKNGLHSYQYTLDNEFFRHFEDSPITAALLEAQVDVDKRSDMMVLEFQLDGYIETECDRCTAMIKMPMSGQQTLYVKYSDSPGEEDDEVVFIGREWSDFNLAKYLYEFSVLALPIINTYDCENDDPLPCNTDVLDKLQAESSSDDDDAPSENPIWDALKKLK
jgi:uncharacterized protein